MKTEADFKRKHVVVLDTSAFLAGFDPFSFGLELVTVPKVEEEIQRKSIVKTRFETAIESGKLKVQLPSEEFSQKVKSVACKVGDAFKLSETDLQLLALAMQLNAEGSIPQVVTDDYSIQNVVKQMDIEFIALATFGIKRLLEWIRYCPACHKEYSASTKLRECIVCGTELKRKPRKKNKR
jgi:endoribonuclease Nob1